MMFRLPNFLQAGYFNALRSEMDAPLAVTFSIEEAYVPIELPIFERLQADGVDVSFDDIQVLGDATLEYRGYRVLLYIRDVNHYNDRATLPKFHVSFCRTLKKMRLAQRFERYVVANRDDGMFAVNLMSESKRARIIKLNVCQNCLAEISWQGFDRLFGVERQRVVADFDLSEFFARYPRDLVSERPAHTSDTAPLNEYTQDWGVVSARRKAAENYTCECCETVLAVPQYSRFLHVHHRNAIKSDNRTENLQVLCIDCHAEQPMHAHMKSTPDFLAYQNMQGRLRIQVRSATS